MRLNWLESKVVSTLFLGSVVVCLICFASYFSIAVPWVRNFLNSSSANNALGILFAALLVLTIPCSLIVSFGMAMFCAFADRSSVGVKVRWFFLFLVTWPLGSIVYFFTVYRGFIKRKRTGSAPDPQVVVAVGTTITDRPLRRSVRARLRIRLL